MQTSFHSPLSALCRGCTIPFFLVHCDKSYSAASFCGGLSRSAGAQHLFFRRVAVAGTMHTRLNRESFPKKAKRYFFFGKHGSSRLAECCNCTSNCCMSKLTPWVTRKFCRLCKHLQTFIVYDACTSLRLVRALSPTRPSLWTSAQLGQNGLGTSESQVELQIAHAHKLRASFRLSLPDEARQ